MSLPSPLAASRRVVWLACVAYLAFVAVVVFWPTPVDRPAAGTLVQTFVWLHRHGVPAWFDYALFEWLANVAFFVPVGALALLLLRRIPLALVTGAVISSVIELTQWLALPERTGSVLDVIANTSGGLLGAVLAQWVLRASDLDDRRRRRGT